MEKTSCCIFILCIVVRLGVLEPIPLEPLDAPCPEDSIVSDEGKCVCHPDSCFKPECDNFLNVLINATGVPGNCCATYSCDACPNEDILAGKCPCPNPETLLSAGEECVCKDPQKILQDNECVCDLSKCPTPEPCDKQSVPVKVQDGCCPKTLCERCPADSYPIPYTTGNEIEEKCICYPCPKDNCAENQTAVVYRRGKTFPNMCCNLYRCEDIKVNDTCQAKGVSYANGDSWYDEGCTKCKCNNGVNLCSKVESCENDTTAKPCFYDDKVFAHRQVWYEDDTCTQCSCNNGAVKCLSHMCEVKTGEAKKNEDCPSLSSCKRICQFGFKINKIGCEICKCKPQPERDFDRAKIVLDMLLQHNMTEEDLRMLLNDKLSSTVPTVVSTDAPTTVETISSTPGFVYNVTDKAAAGQECSGSNFQMYMIIVCGVSIILFIFCCTFVWYKGCRDRNRNSLTITSPHNSYQPIKLCDANLNSEFINPNKKYEMKVMSSIKAPI